MYTCKLIMYTCVINYINMRDDRIYMQDNYVYMQDNHVYIQDIYVYMKPPSNETNQENQILGYSLHADILFFVISRLFYERS